MTVIVDENTSGAIGVFKNATIKTVDGTENFVRSRSEEGNSNAIFVQGDLTISGKGKLTVVGEEAGIHAEGNIEINAPITATSTGKTKGCSAIMAVGGNKKVEIKIGSSWSIVTPADGRAMESEGVAWIAAGDKEEPVSNVVIGIAAPTFTDGLGKTDCTFDTYAKGAENAKGYTFAGWYSDEALTQKVTSVKLNGNTTVYAKWTENAVTPTLPFTDVKSGDWFYEAVQYVYDKGMMTGVSADRFAPASTTTRGMIVTILYRLENEPAVSGGSAFTDVENGAWYADAVAWAAANDIVNGTSATTFAPNSPITREQMAAILYRYAAYKGYDVSQNADLSGYTDAASISDYAKDALAWANAQKLITGVTDTTLNPQGSATRAQVATILMRLCETVVK